MFDNFDVLGAESFERIHIAVASLALEEIGILRKSYVNLVKEEGKVTAPSRLLQEHLKKNYDNCMRISVAYGRLVAFLCGKVIPEDDKTKNKFKELYVTFKTAV